LFEGTFVDVTEIDSEIILLPAVGNDGGDTQRLHVIIKQLKEM